MKKKLFILRVKLEDMTFAGSEKEAKQQFRKDHKEELEGIADSQITCEEFDGIMQEIKGEREGASSSVCEEVLSQDMRHVNWSEADDNGE